MKANLISFNIDNDIVSTNATYTRLLFVWSRKVKDPDSRTRDERAVTPKNEYFRHSNTYAVVGLEVSAVASFLSISGVNRSFPWGRRYLFLGWFRHCLFMHVCCARSCCGGPRMSRVRQTRLPANDQGWVMMCSLEAVCNVTRRYRQFPQLVGRPRITLFLFASRKLLNHSPTTSVNGTSSHSSFS